MTWLSPAEPHHRTATEGLRQAAAAGEIGLPLIAFSECLVRPYRQGVAAARRVERKLTAVATIAVPTIDIARQTAHLRATRSLKTPDALVIATEWPIFKKLDLERVRKQLTHPILFDGRNLFDPKEMEEMGFIYKSVGR